MIRIAPNRCGYSGYVCNHSLPVARPIQMTCPPNTIDDFMGLPEKAIGMVMKIAPGGVITGIGDVAFPYPESTCIITPEHPFAFELAYSAGVQLPAANYLDDYPGEAIAPNGFVPCFSSGGMASSGGCALAPPVLEPMLNTNFSPVDVVAVPSIDASLDGIMITLKALDTWRSEVDLRLNNIRVPKTKGILELIGAEELESTCDEFYIELTSGVPVQTQDDGSPVYSVAGGTIHINNTAVSVSGISGQRVPAEGVLNFYLAVDTENLTATITTSNTGNLDYYDIGGIQKTTSHDIDPSVPLYIVYKIEQRQCSFNIGGGGSGSDVFIGVVSQAPSGGFGVGTVQKAVFNSDGTYTISNNTISVVFPYI